MQPKLRDGHRKEGRWILAPLSDITTPKPGYICYGPAYWLVTANNEVMFYEYYSSPQCNASEELVRRLLARPDGPWGGVARDTVFVEVAFLPHRCEE